MDDAGLKINKQKRILIVILIIANLILFLAGIILIPNNLKKTVNREGVADEIASEHLVSEDNEIPTNSGENISTQERPDLNDFLWYTEDVFTNGLPADVTDIKSYDSVKGGWKGLIIYDPNNIAGANAMEFLNVNISGTENNLSMTLDWYQMFISGEGNSFDETDMEDAVFSGEWSMGSMRASAAGCIYITKFYEINKKQYAVGTMDTPDGIEAFIALVRP